MADDDTERIYKEMASSKQVSCYTFNFFYYGISFEPSTFP